jgi:hypothetical protein
LFVGIVIVKTAFIGQLGAIAVRQHLGGHQADAAAIARHVGAPWACDMVAKAAVGANESLLAVDAGTGIQLNASIDQMISRSLLLMCQQRGSPDFGLRAGLLQLDEVSPTGVVVDENNPSPIQARVPYGVISVTPGKIVFLTPITLELARSPFAAAAIQARAEDGLSRGLDAALLNLIAPGSGGGLVASSDSLADVLALIELVSITGAQPIILGANPGVAARMATLRQGGVLCFPGACAVGQSEVAGLPMLATDRVAAESMMVIDPSGIAVHVDAIEVSASQNGSLLMSTAPDNPGQLVSSFQTGMIVVSVSARFSLAVIRQQDVSGELTEISWANS